MGWTDCSAASKLMIILVKKTVEKSTEDEVFPRGIGAQQSLE